MIEAAPPSVVVVGASESSRRRITPADVCVGAVERMKRVRKAARREKRLLRTSIVFQRERVGRKRWIKFVERI